MRLSFQAAVINLHQYYTRMELALAELGLEGTQELEDDVDFVNDKGV